MSSKQNATAMDRKVAAGLCDDDSVDASVDDSVDASVDVSKDVSKDASKDVSKDDSKPALEPAPMKPTVEEDALLVEVKARIGRRPAPLANRMLSDLQLAENRFLHPATDLNPYGHFQFLIRLQRELRRAENDGTPELFEVPDSKGVTYPELIAAWIEEGQWVTTQRGSRVLLKTGDDVMHLSEAMPAAEAVRQRIQVAIDGNGSEPELIEALRLFVWDKRRTPVSRPAMLNHLGLAVTSIRNLAAEVRKAMATPPEEIPEEVRGLKGEAHRDAERKLSPWLPSVQRAVLGLERLLPRADEAIHNLASAVDGRTRPASTEIWSRPVQVLVGAQELMLSDFLRNAANTAAEARLPSLINLLAPRRGPDNVPVNAPDPESPPAEGETFVPFDESEERNSETRTSGERGSEAGTSEQRGSEAGTSEERGSEAGTSEERGSETGTSGERSSGEG